MARKTSEIKTIRTLLQIMVDGNLEYLRVEGIELKRNPYLNKEIQDALPKTQGTNTKQASLNSDDEALFWSAN